MDSPKLKALLVSADPNVCRVIARVMNELEIVSVTVPSAQAGSALLTSENWDALLVDCSLEKQGDVFKSLRRRPYHKRSVAIAIVNGEISLGAAFHAGANFLVHKPLTVERVRGSLRAARVLATRKRTTSRHPLQVMAHVSCGASLDLSGVVINMSETGLAAKMSEPVDTGRAVLVRVNLPRRSDPIEAHGETVWVNREGHVGIRFVHFPHAQHQRVLTRWLQYMNAAAEI